MPNEAVHAMTLTMVTAISAGVVLIAIGRRVGIPAIVLLLAGGVGLGPVGLGYVAPDSLGDGLRVIVSFAIGIILFEGGLTLDLEGYRSASRLIRRLLSVGVLVTWLGTALAARLLVGLPAGLSIIVGSLVIVTGPTVIGPLLQRIRVTHKLHSILHWEGVLIDPIGVFIALLCFEFIGEDAGMVAVVQFGLRIAAGLGIGVLGGFVIDFLVRRKLVPSEMLDVFAFGLAILLFGLSEMVVAEAGLLSMTVAGFVVGMRKPAELKRLKAFKAQITDLSIGTLFILLAARLEIAQFLAFGWEGYALVGVLMLLVRPAGVLLSSHGLDMNWREKLFLSWVAPRGIVAASMASLVALSLEHSGSVEDPKFVETFTYSVIFATIVLQGTSAGALAWLLRLKRKPPRGWLIAGAHAFGRGVARFLVQQADREVVLVDTNTHSIAEARAEGLTAIEADARDAEQLSRRDEFHEVGRLFALTDNDAMNVLICQRWSEPLGRDNVYRWAPAPRDEDCGDPCVGEVVWDVLPKPSMLSAELTRGESWLMWGHREHCQQAQGQTRPLLAVDERGVGFRPGACAEGQCRPDESLLCLRRDADHLGRAARPELFARLAPQSLRELLEQLVQLTARYAPGLRPETLVAELHERESRFPNRIGHGVLVPHVFLSGMRTRLVTAVAIPSGLALPDDEDEPIRLAFLVLGPRTDPEGHLATLADLARLVVHDDVRQALIDAPDGEAYTAILREHLG